mgnify:CR=1 FL=1
MSVETFMRKVVLNIIHPICMLFSRGRPPLSHCYAQLSLAETTICLPAFIYDHHSFTTPTLVCRFATCAKSMFPNVLILFSV